MRLLRKQTKNAQGNRAAIVHVLLTAALPLAAYVLVRLGFGWAAIALIFLSKWRMFAVKARHWPANIRANAVDIFVGLSVVIFMLSTDVQALQLSWPSFSVYKPIASRPRVSALWVGAQALIAQALSFAALFYYWSDASVSVLVFAAWVIAYFCARHFFTAFDEAMSRSTAYSWAFFAASITWLSGHWLIFYGPIAQPALLLTVLGYGLASMYYLDHKDKLTRSMFRQFVSLMVTVVLFLIIFSEWSDKTI